MRPLRSRITTTTRRLPDLVDGKPTIAPVILEVRRFHVAAEVAAIDFHFAGNGLVLGLSRDGFTKLMGEHEGRLVLNV